MMHCSSSIELLSQRAIYLQVQPNSHTYIALIYLHMVDTSTSLFHLSHYQLHVWLLSPTDLSGRRLQF
jgi:hypothetical protein